MAHSHTTPMPGEKAPALQFDRIEGEKFDLRDSHPENFTVIAFYRGVHCPICKKQLEALNGKIGDFREKGIDIVAVSMDSVDRAERQKSEWDIPNLNIGYGLPIESARDYGLFISAKAKDAEPERFSEPGIAVIKPDGTLYALYIQNTPFGRISFDELMSGLEFITKNDYPIRGTSKDDDFTKVAAE
ncbi:peroxiredoxin-like family protein [Oricola cellulosilytica]|uniref:AhpC/TSA family protein n=1 Tax=Oricola cellulosilytica TaxID=1429082 RepID=A0A4R0PEK1_9HYPH|nr:peroxiredoxin-like family protein [Oricola cellulosilytica]TCD15058.1 AhpC/TSA family protein [Oricola cellulosilytica]